MKHKSRQSNQPSEQVMLLNVRYEGEDHQVEGFEAAWILGHEHFPSSITELGFARKTI